MRWSSNFTPEFEKMDATVIYEVTDEGKENVRVKVEIEGKSLEMPWQEFLKNHVEEARHSIMRRNVLLATRNFNHRVECFRQEVIFGRNNPMSVRHISYRVEFQGISLKKKPNTLFAFPPELSQMKLFFRTWGSPCSRSSLDRLPRGEGRWGQQLPLAGGFSKTQSERAPGRLREVYT